MSTADSLTVTDQASAAVARFPKGRVALADIENAIKRKYEFTAGQALLALGHSLPSDSSTQILSVCILEMANGFVVIGKSAPASPMNFNVELGRKYAYEDAVRQVWPLMGYALRDKLSQ